MHVFICTSVFLYLNAFGFLPIILNYVLIRGMGKSLSLIFSFVHCIYDKTQASLCPQLQYDSDSTELKKDIPGLNSSLKCVFF